VNGIAAALVLAASFAAIYLIIMDRLTYKKQKL